MARSTRIHKQTTDEESDSEDVPQSEEEQTPRPIRKSKGKKRVSDVFEPTGSDFASGSNPSRVPFKQVNLNDDEAEKKRRRKSKKLLQPYGAVLNEPSDEQPGVSEGDVAIETPKANRQLQQKLQLMAVAETPIVNVPIDVMNSNFEEWMKLATDNKINATNSWNFALIDYFHDMSLLRNNVDNSINFQKASATLDGCVKIWTSRVDSVGTETGRLLSNLAEDGQPADDEEGAETIDPETGEASQRTKRQGRNHRPESTLAKNAAQLRTKKLDLEFSVDPLFKKTCADFDEGGAQGLLMNHLSLGVGTEGSMRVIFDASDSMGKAQDEDEDEDVVEPEDLIDISYLRSEFLPDMSALESKAISYSISDFSFGKSTLNLDNTNLLEGNYGADSISDDDDDGMTGGFTANAMKIDMNVGDDQGQVEDFFGGDDAIGDDYGGIDMATNDPNVGEDDNANAESHGHLGGIEPFDPQRAPNEHDLILAMTEAGAEGGSLDYFDQAFLRNWAGPEHWKLRKVVRRPEQSGEATTTKQKREKKEPFKIDFLTPSEMTLAETIKTLFAPVSKGGSITLPLASSKSGNKKSKSLKSKDTDKRFDHTLPDDMHFSSRQLVTLFLKPKFALKMRGHGPRYNARDGEVDENFWAQAANEQAAGTVDEADESNGGAIPFNTQFFHDDDDDGPGFDDVYDNDGGGDLGLGGVDNSGADAGEQDLLSVTQSQSRRVRPELVNYAKRAKRVDVRKLKDNIWKGLDIVIPDTQDGDGDLSMNDTSTQSPTDPSEARVFTSVISDLESSYPKEKLEEISTSFCFICLLHLANEKGLKIRGEKTENDTSMSIEGEIDTINDLDDQPVGDIWGLKIYRDPNAVAAA